MVYRTWQAVGGRGQLRRARRRVLGCACAALAGSTVLGALVASPAPAVEGEAARPNVVVVMTDDQRLDDLRVMRQTRQAMVGGGTSFRRFYTTLPLCCPSRVTFLTGQYAHNHGIYTGQAPAGGYFTFKDAQDATMPVALDDAGYETAHLGKYVNGYPQQVEGKPGDVPPGWDRWLALLRWRMFGFSLNVDGDTKPFSGRGKYQTDVLARRAAGLLRAHAEQEDGDPLFLSVATLAPHLEPSQKGRPGANPRPARRHEGRFARRALPSSPALNERDVSDKPAFVANRKRRSARQMRTYRKRHQDRLASLLAVDDLVDRIFATLEATGELENTYVILTSDNGFLLGEHRLRGKNRLYEEAVRVPTLITGPGVPAGLRLTQITGNVDLAPTIYDIAGVTDPPVEPDGVSLLDVIAGPEAFEEREIVLETNSATGLRTPRWAYIEHEGDPQEPGADEFELYDMQADPGQEQNLYVRTLGPEHPDHDPKSFDPELELVRVGLAVRLDELRDCAGDGCRAP